ncbi:hypothetical protein FRACYDRAFT_237454 [Fragilariopsis cylindrus CCMP1102]|uniref:Uncharacterized protein n=1 Tax=Fragilariopsis cylindrus CCMP1102 TaxID=635003 RepID=A0A1E7FM10_9STRA|nr:hypothetical protein FRACYDRAFT_237454 [Fragilariopsis cylindrus CCMP1102]|eukprot:OEU19164.1 hypothetical protein FRACYDRAFT_237454 [Fragilariopsis cylindrus CCMP1102]
MFTASITDRIWSYPSQSGAYFSNSNSNKDHIKNCNIKRRIKLKNGNENENENGTTNTGNIGNTNTGNTIGDKRKSKTGMLFVRPYKVGSSSVVGIQLQINKNIAERITKSLSPQQQKQQEEDDTTTSFENDEDCNCICDSSFHHSTGLQLRPMKLLDNDNNQSNIKSNSNKNSNSNSNQTTTFLWTMLRHPTKRAISHYFFRKISRDMSEYSDQNFIHFLEGSQNYNTTRSSRTKKKKKKKKDFLLPTIPRTQNTISTYLLRHTTNKTSYQKLKKSIQTIYKISFPSNYLSMSMMLDTTTNNGTNSTNVTLQDYQQNQEQYYQEPTPQDQQNLLSDSEYQSIANSIILQEYNFIAVMERFDESMVVLQMLLNGPPRPDNDTNNTDTNTDDNTNVQNSVVGQIKLGDLLYLSSKQAGSYDDGQSKNKNGDKICHKLFKSFTTNTMTNYFNYEPPPPSSIIGNNNRHRHINPNYISYQERIKWDYALWKAANISLDNTINNLLGKEKFHKQLTKYKDALQEVQKHCSRKAIYPCSDANKQQIIKSNGNGNGNSNSTADGQSPLSRNETNCLYDDAGCGYKCIHDIAKKLQLL